jgi:hypothetical protein
VTLTLSDLLATGDRWIACLPATPDDIARLESALGLRVPGELRAALLASNGLKLPHPYLDDPQSGMLGLLDVDGIIDATRQFRAHVLDGERPWLADVAPGRLLLIAETVFGDALAYLCDDADPAAATLVQIHQDQREGDSLDPLTGLTLLDLLADLGEED